MDSSQFLNIILIAGLVYLWKSNQNEIKIKNIDISLNKPVTDITTDNDCNFNDL